MPFYGVERPSIQIGLLSAIADQHGHSGSTYHLNLELAHRLTPEVYQGLCQHGLSPMLRRAQTGEWLFSVAAFGDDATPDEQFFEAFPDDVAGLQNLLGLGRSELSDLRNRVIPDFVDWCATSFDWSDFTCVGFTSTFQQNVASLALASRIKARSPETIIVFGGANFEGTMGHAFVDAFPYVDHAVTGEGDVVFAELLNDLAAGRAVQPGPGLYSRGQAATTSQRAPIERYDLDRLPVPDYGEYFERANALGFQVSDGYPKSLPFESSRGCWWGAKHHCTFCGMNGSAMQFRSKSPERVLEELRVLSERHRITAFAAVDLILDMPYISSLFPVIERELDDFTFFYEVKATLTKSQLRAIYAGGVRAIQPGIESLSSRVLSLMDKGTTMLKNVRLLKWACYYGFDTNWNLLYGFPGEAAQDYETQLETMRLIGFLQPPECVGRIWLERYSPLFSQSSLGLTNIRPELSYSIIYPRELDLAAAAYFFEYEAPTTLPDSFHDDASELVKGWKQRWASNRPDRLTFRSVGDVLLIDDQRAEFPNQTYKFDGWVAELYLLCSDSMRDVPTGVSQLAAIGFLVNEKTVRCTLEEFCSRGLMLTEAGLYLALALPVNPNH